MIKNQYDDTLTYIHSLGMYSKKRAVDLRKIKYLCSLFDNPQESFDTVHIAGTNGKGSVTAMLSSIFIKLDYRTGKYISPFIERFNERISVDGRDISDDDLILYTNLIKEKIRSSNVPEDFLPNEFEFITLMAFLYYKNNGCDIAVLETGLGGRLDPTNIVKNPLASVIMSISLDHTEILGDSIEKIAKEKCGIIKDNSMTVIYPMNQPDIINLIKSAAASKNNAAVIPDVSQIEIIEETLAYTRFRYKKREYNIRLIGRHQIHNAVTAIETVMSLYESNKLKEKNIDTLYNAIYNGLAETYFPARFEILSEKPTVIFDGAHNISGIEVLADNIEKLLNGKKITLVCGMLRDKKPETALEKILNLPQIERFIAVPLESKRAMPPEELYDIALRYHKNAEYISTAEDMKLSLRNIVDNASEHEVVLCFGSLFLAGEIKDLF